MILCPTRELAIQVADEDPRKLAKFMHGAKVLPIYGGQNITNQIRSLKTGANISSKHRAVSWIICAVIL